MASEDEEEGLSDDQRRDDDLHEEVEEEPAVDDPPKKARPGRACDNCRRKKVKCDGNPCQNCKNHNLECTFNQHLRKRQPKRDSRYVQRVETRLQRLTSFLERTNRSVLADFKKEEGKSPGSRRLSRPLPTMESAPLAVSPSVFFSVDPLGTCLGPTSPWTLLYDTRNYSAQALQMNTIVAPQIHQYLSVSASQASLPNSLQQNYSPVAQDQAGQYIEKWFAYAKHVHGYLHRPTLESTAQTLHNPTGRVHVEYLSLYNAVLGLGAWLEGDMARCTQFLQIAWVSLAPRIHYVQSLQAVQAAFHLSLLLSFLGRYGIAYSLLGYCIRTAYSLGLHHETPRDNRDFIQIEERRRLFWGLFFLDATYSLLMGRPPLISELDIDVELPSSISDEKITPTEILPDDIDEEQEEYIHTQLKTLAQEFRRIYEDLYSIKVSKGRTRTDLSDSIHVLEDYMANWRALLPTQNRSFLSGQDPVAFGSAPPLQILFSIGYFYGLCLIRRPALIETTRPLSSIWPEEVESSSVATGSRREGARPLKSVSEDCVTNARDLLNLIIDAPLQSYGHFPIFPTCILTAGSIIVDNLIRDPMADDAETDLGLLANVRRLVEQNFDQNLRRSLVAAISELQQISNTALRHAPTFSPQLPRIPESQQSPFFNPQLPQLYFGDIQFPDDPFVAAPLSGSSTFPPAQASGFPAPPIIGSPYGQQLDIQFPPAESSLSMGSTRPPMTAATPILQEPVPHVQSPSFPPAAPTHRRAHSSSAIPQSPLHVQAHIQQQAIAFPAAPTPEWEQPRRGHSGSARRGERRVGHSRSRSRPR